jgi:dTDP-4-dehydrorhamnose reductase
VVLEEIFLTGGSGTLGVELIKQSHKFDINFVAPPSRDCDITDEQSVCNNLMKFKGDIVLHAAATTNVRAIQTTPMAAIDINVLGTVNIIKACQQFNKRLVFISTDYVFDGEKGNYNTGAPINPISKYAKTKAAAELLVRCIENTLIIRTSFFGYDFPYDKAAVDQWSSKDYVDVIAPLVLKVLKGRKTGIVHVGTARTTTYEKAQRRKPFVEGVYLQDLGFGIPRDISLEGTG